MNPKVRTNVIALILMAFGAAACQQATESQDIGELQQQAKAGAKSNLGLAYYEVDGVEQNFTQSYAWLIIAIKHCWTLPGIN